MTEVWRGPESLRDDLVPIPSLTVDASGVEGDLTAVRRGLEIFGQVRPVLTDEDGKTVTYRGHLVEAARELGWTHIATRLDAAESGTEAGQLTLLDEVAKTAEGEDRTSLLNSLSGPSGAETEDDIERINRESADPDQQWVGLPEFLPVEEPVKVVVSCDTEGERDALFDVLGIETIHKGTRGTISVWWPDREKKDLASLRFIAGRRSAA